MKASIKYYSIDEDCAVEKRCNEFSYNPTEDSFTFTPMEILNIYKTCKIYSPKIHIDYGDERITMYIDGWMQSKQGQYIKTTTKIIIKSDD